MGAGGGAGGELGAARVSQDGRGGGAPAGVRARVLGHGCARGMQKQNEDLLSWVYVTLCKFLC
jgi:hypothetical protein